MKIGSLEIGKTPFRDGNELIQICNEAEKTELFTYFNSRNPKFEIGFTRDRRIKFKRNCGVEIEGITSFSQGLFIKMYMCIYKIRYAETEQIAKLFPAMKTLFPSKGLVSYSKNGTKSFIYYYNYNDEWNVKKLNLPNGMEYARPIIIQAIQHGSKEIIDSYKENFDKNENAASKFLKYDLPLIKQCAALFAFNIAIEGFGLIGKVEMPNTEIANLKADFNVGLLCDSENFSREKIIQNLTDTCMSLASEFNAEVKDKKSKELFNKYKNNIRNELLSRYPAIDKISFANGLCKITFKNGIIGQININATPEKILNECCNKDIKSYGSIAMAIEGVDAGDSYKIKTYIQKEVADELIREKSVSIAEIPLIKISEKQIVNNQDKIFSRIRAEKNKVKKEFFDTNLQIYYGNGNDFFEDDYYYNPVSDIISYHSPLVEIELNNKMQFNIKHTKEGRDVLKDRDTAKYKKAFEFVKECYTQSDDGIKLSLNHSIDHGILDGKTEISFFANVDGSDNYSETFVYNGPSYKDGITEYRKQIKTFFKNVRETFRNKHIKRKEEERKRVSDYLNNFIYKDIARFVIANEKYITANAVAYNLSGRKNPFHGDIHNIPNSGKYGYYSKDEIVDFIDNLIDDDIIKERELKGTYGYFDILKSTHDLENISSLDHEPINVKSWMKTTLKNPINNDVAAKQIFNEIKTKEEKETKDYMILLNLIPSKGFICLYEKEFLKEFSNCPNEIIDYLKTLKSITDDRYTKKILNLILSFVKENSR